MTELDDRLRFFHRHAQQLRTWAKLEPELTRLVDQTLAERLEGNQAGDFFHDRQPDAQVQAPLTDAKWPKLRLFRAGWGTGNGSDVCVAMQWERGRVTLDALHAPVVGVWVNSHVPELRKIHAQLRDATAEYRSRHSDASTDRWWPALRRLPAQGDDHLTDLDRYIDWVLEQILIAWSELSPIVDTVVEDRDGSAA